ncbi:hypothetical protein LAZ67_3006035 [Cordylochernes scorpioides]|uniref:Uncharacterized protein n=1 Tax=Cordylochernes scorpioides TaxID=51811 RepID=A0ABY6KDV3_9ARAC|nr:hypothetical protein LAZ67_3006035 [Cordylochernes scorpioides]
MLFNAVHSVIYRLQAVIENEGCHIEQGLDEEGVRYTSPPQHLVSEERDDNKEKKSVRSLGAVVIFFLSPTHSHYYSGKWGTPTSGKAERYCQRKGDSPEWWFSEGPWVVCRVGLQRRSTCAKGR